MAGVSETWVNPETAVGSGGLDVATNDTLAATYFDALASNLDYLGGSDGNQKTGLLNLLAGQIQFPAAQSASANANTLDDYEEGTWTPLYQGSTGSIGATAYTTQAGKYVKSGQHLTIQCALALSNNGDWTGNVQIWGNPFTFGVGDDVSTCYGAVRMDNVTFTGAPAVAAVGGATFSYIYLSATGAPASILGASGVPDTGAFYYTITGRAAA